MVESLGKRIEIGRGCTWPPEKPTATTPSSLLLVKNLGAMVDGEVMMIVG